MTEQKNCLSFLTSGVGFWGISVCFEISLAIRHGGDHYKLFSSNLLTLYKYAGSFP